MANNQQATKREYDIEPYLMTILSKKFEAVTQDMTQSLLRAARSGVINIARDFSSGITLYDGRQLVIDEGVPVQLANIDLVPQYTMEKFDDIEPGDLFLTNSPYAGNVHHADYTYHAPVFYDGEPLFWVMSRAHQADIGANEPSTYLPEVEDVYQEAMHLPSVRIQRDYEDMDDIVRMLKTNIRLGDTQWHGDYQAQVASVRAGEEGLKELCDEYGAETVMSFTEAWLDYGEQMMRNEIQDLPAKTVEHTSYHDPIPGAEDGVPINVKMEIVPDEGRIYVDLTDNIDYLPNGFNLCEATTVAGVYTAIFNNLSSEIPYNEGSMNRVEIDMETGKFIGKEEFPAATAVSTTHGFDVLVNALQAAFGDLGETYGIAQGNPGFPPSYAVISGTDFRRDGEQYVNQIFHLGGGGPAMHGHDGWETFVIPAGAGVTRRDSIELDEQKYPILVSRNELLTDSEGAGQWRGSPGSVSEFSPRGAPMTVAYIGNGVMFPPEGIRGGTDGAPQAAKKRTADGEVEDLPPMGFAEIEPEEAIIGHVAGGGGYGRPSERDPTEVLQDVEDGIVTKERARDVYGVIIDESDGSLSIDDQATRHRRTEMTGGDD